MKVKHSIENKFEPFVGQCFLSEEETFIFLKQIMQINMVFQFGNVDLS
jgi:hypothetical protein